MYKKALELLRKSGVTQLIRDVYISCVDGEPEYCVWGALLKERFTKEELDSLGGIVLKAAANPGHHTGERLLAFLDEIGLTVEEADELQAWNDHQMDVSPEERYRAVVKFMEDEGEQEVYDA